MNSPTNRKKGGTFNISVLARMLGRSRETIRRAIADCRIEATGRQSGHDAYNLADVAQAIFGLPSNGDEMSPLERLNFYKSELARIALAEKCGGLIPVHEFDRVYSGMIKVVSASLETLPDRLERDIGLSGKQIEYVTNVIDNLRESMYEKLIDQHRDPG